MSDVPTFEKVWEDILEFAERERSVRTLDQKILNRVVDVQKDQIVVVSERTGKERPVKKEDVKADWEILAGKGTLVNGEEKSWHGSIIAAFLAQLPYISYTLRPRTLYLK
jgi:hypothetical protein